MKELNIKELKLEEEYTKFEQYLDNEGWSNSCYRYKNIDIVKLKLEDANREYDYFLHQNGNFSHTLLRSKK